MHAPNTNPHLSGLARATWMLFATVGRVMSSSEIQEGNYMNEGRDAIRSAMTELKRSGYIKAVKEQTSNGRWVTSLKFTELGKKYVDLFNWNYQPVPTPNLPTPGIPYVGEPVTTSSKSLESYKELELLRNSNQSGAPITKEVEMGWPILEEGEEPKKKTRGFVEDSDSGAIGKIQDKQAKINLKYKATTFEAVPASMRRYERLEDNWTTDDLIAEFYDKIREHCPGIPGQVNGKSLISWMNKLVGQGVHRSSILKGIRMFFADPRNLHNSGIGTPMWRRFIAYYPTIHGLTTKSEVEYVDDNFLAHQEKMLKLLGGN